MGIRLCISVEFSGIMSSCGPMMQLLLMRNTGTMSEIMAFTCRRMTVTGCSCVTNSSRLQYRLRRSSGRRWPVKCAPAPCRVWWHLPAEAIAAPAQPLLLAATLAVQQASHQLPKICETPRGRHMLSSVNLPRTGRVKALPTLRFAGAKV
jgi:hypothetical protein